MCLVSAVGDNWKETYPERWPSVPFPQYPFDSDKVPNKTYPLEYATKEDVAQLRLEMLQLKELLLAAKKFDEKTGQKNCEMEEKVRFIKQVADAVGVDLSEVFGNK